MGLSTFLTGLASAVSPRRPMPQGLKPCLFDLLGHPVQWKRQTGLSSLRVEAPYFLAKTGRGSTL